VHVIGKYGGVIGLVGAKAVVTVNAGSAGPIVPYTSFVESCRKPQAVLLSPVRWV
jgi:hypothetical protein